MSVHYIYKGNGGAKFMRPVPNREEYLSLRNGGFQKENVARIRQGDGALKASLVQMNYSCLPNEDGTLKGSKRMSTTVGMDIDHLSAENHRGQIHDSMQNHETSPHGSHSSLRARKFASYGMQNRRSTISL